MSNGEADFDLPENAEARELEKAAQMLDNLLYAADGGKDVYIDQWGASTILAMLDDPAYYAKAKEACDAAREEEEDEIEVRVPAE